MTRIIDRSLKLELTGYSLPDVIKEFQELQEEYGDKVSLSLETESDYGDEMYAVLYLNYKSPETDAERTKRERYEKQHADRAIARDKSELERLLKLYGTTGVTK